MCSRAQGFLLHGLPRGMAGSADNGALQGGDFRPLSDFAIREWGLDFIYGGMLWAGIPEDVAQSHVASLRPTMERCTGSWLLWNRHWETEQNEDPLFQRSFRNIFGCEFWDHLRQLEVLEPPTPSRRLRGKQTFPPVADTARKRPAHAAILGLASSSDEGVRCGLATPQVSRRRADPCFLVVLLWLAYVNPKLKIQ